MHIYFHQKGYEYISNENLNFQSIVIFKPLDIVKVKNLSCIF